MAEIALPVISALLNKLISLAAGQISLVWGVYDDLQILSEKLEMIQALLADAQAKQLTSKAVQLWLKKLKKIALDADILLDDFQYEILREKIESGKGRKVQNFLSSTSNSLAFRVEMAKKIKNIILSVEKAYKESNEIGLQAVELINMSPDVKQIRLTDPFVDDFEIVGRKNDITELTTMLTRKGYKRDLPIITIVGMAGLGKTTLAQLVYKNSKVVRWFDKRIWICVSDDFKVERLLNEMLQSVNGNYVDHMTNREAMVKRLQECLKEKRYLLVLDDIWNENRDRWDCLRKCLLEIGGSKGSKVLATTRSDGVASTMQSSESHRLEMLSEDYSWKLVEKIAFAKGGAKKTRQLVDIGRRIIKSCRGVPLALKAIGNLLYSKNGVCDWLKIDRSEIWNSFCTTDDGVLSSIKLSYDNLPSLLLKQSFAYCSIFRKDTILDKDKLVQIWMANGLLYRPKGSDLQMEDVGSNYFDILLQCSLLQDPQKDRYNNITGCKIHDLVHDFSLQVSATYCFNAEDGLEVNEEMEAMHLSLIVNGEKKLKNMKGTPFKARTCYLVNGGLSEDMLINFRYLTVLIMENWNSKDLPNAIVEMKHLRYLDISATSIQRIPEPFTNLYNLQTLRVHDLKELPKGFGNLINLRHFHFEICQYGYEWRCLLPGIGQLTNLQTLPFFKVSRGKECRIEELQHLHNLKGKLQIFSLHNVTSYESAKKANLSRKENIHSLELFWSGTKEYNNANDVLEGLKPHSNLKRLRIVGCQNSNFPSWMETKIYLSQLVNLVEIKLDRLEMCEQVPSLGNLPCLQILHMFGLHNVKCIGKEFYGYTCVDSSSNFSSNGEEIFLFPSLKELRLVNMCRLTEWSDAMIPSCSSIKVFPNLKELYLYGLPKLKVLPDLSILTCLQQLEIHHCHSLSCLQNVNRLASLQVLEISNSQTSFWFTDCPNLTLPAKCTRPSEDFKCLEGLLFTLFQKVRLALECLLDRCGF